MPSTEQRFLAAFSQHLSWSLQARWDVKATAFKGMVPLVGEKHLGSSTKKSYLNGVQNLASRRGLQFTFSMLGWLLFQVFPVTLKVLVIWTRDCFSFSPSLAISRYMRDEIGLNYSFTSPQTEWVLLERWIFSTIWLALSMYTKSLPSLCFQNMFFCQSSFCLNIVSSVLPTPCNQSKQALPPQAELGIFHCNDNPQLFNIQGVRNRPHRPYRPHPAQNAGGVLAPAVFKLLVNLWTVVDGDAMSGLSCSLPRGCNPTQRIHLIPKLTNAKSGRLSDRAHPQFSWPFQPVLNGCLL